jgi:hypothetical protein
MATSGWSSSVSQIERDGLRTQITSSDKVALRVHALLKIFVAESTPQYSDTASTTTYDCIVHWAS